MVMHPNCTSYYILEIFMVHLCQYQSHGMRLLNYLGDILIMGNDDQEYQTQYWDTTLEGEVNKYPDDIYCAWFEDKINGPKHCAFPIISRKWYDTVGYFAPGVFNFGYNDTWVYDIAKRVGRTHFIPDVVVEHKHFSKARVKWMIRMLEIEHKRKVICMQKIRLSLNKQQMKDRKTLINY